MTLTAERLRQLLHYDKQTGIFRWSVSRGPLKAGTVAGRTNEDGYTVVMINSKDYRAHRLAWLYVYGAWPIGVIDHRDGDKANNRLDNLRDSTRTENQQNAHAPQRGNSTGFRGVVPTRYGFKAMIGVNGEQLHLGSFRTAEEAHAAYVAAKERYHPTAYFGHASSNISASEA